MKNWGCNDLKELLDYAPACVEKEDKTYCLNFFKGNSGFMVEYAYQEDEMYVDLQGIKFHRKYSLFDTYRMNHDLFMALSSMLDLLFEHKKELRFIPRVHPFNAE